MTRQTAGQQTSAQQTLTIARPAVDVLSAWEHPETVSRLLGEYGHLELESPGRYRWVIQGSDRAWTTLLSRGAGEVRFEQTADEADGSPASLVISTKTAPQDQGTEVTLRLDVPVPDLAAGAAAFTVLYRLRALLMTGEIPALRPQPSGRKGGDV